MITVAARLTCKEHRQLTSRQPMVRVDMARTMRDSNFKNGLCHIDGDGRMLHGTPPDVWFLRTDRDDFGTSMPFKSPGAVQALFVETRVRKFKERTSVWTTAWSFGRACSLTVTANAKVWTGHNKFSRGGMVLRLHFQEAKFLVSKTSNERSPYAYETALTRVALDGCGSSCVHASIGSTAVEDERQDLRI